MSDQVIDSPAAEAAASRPDAKIALRWEWRTFGRSFGTAEKRFAELTPSGSVESDEIYFLSACGDNVKVRDGLMDVKVLRAIDANGLEQWAPVMKAEFPLSALDAQKVVHALRVQIYQLQRDSYSLDDTLEALSRPESGVRIVKVHKLRTRYTVEGCMAEVSDITANGIAVRTIAFESEDPSAVTRAVEAFGLAGFQNTNYPRGLAAAIDRTPERYAVIDVGTNSVKFHIGQRDPDGAWTAVVDRAELTRLGEGLAETGRIDDAALDRTVEAIAGMKAEAERFGVRAIAAVGTAGLRIATNSAEAIAAIRERAGVKVEVVSGDEEARLAYLATTAELGPIAGTVVVFDTGGGSSQFTFGSGGKIGERFSVDVGAARYTERFALDNAVSEKVVAEALDAITHDLSKLDNRDVPDALVGMGGAVTNITAVSLGLANYDPDRVQGSTITLEEIDRQIALYRTSDTESRRSIVGLQPKRAEVILAGACIVRTIMTKLGKTAVTVSDRGLRHGLLHERFGQ